MNMPVQVHTPASAFLGAIPLSAPKPEGSGSSTLEQPLSPYAKTAQTSVAVICESRIFGTCLTRCLQAMASDYDVLSHDNLRAWLDGAAANSHGIVLLCATGQKATATAITQDLHEIQQVANGTRVIIVSDVEQPSLMMASLTAGAKGYVTMDMDLDVALGAIRLVDVGGCFIPASGIMSGRNAQATAEAPMPRSSGFSDRQLEVLELARQGDPNKVIAYKLNLSEATVKVHLRNMMRKLKAKNRTELIFKSNELLDLY
ncbi:DNA-binding response regulator [Labrys miyagiensis]